MNINSRPDQEAKIQEAIKSGLVRSEMDIIDIGLDAVFKKTQEESKTDVVNRLSSFGRRHNLSIGESTIKELINEGRL
jgi:hypothetical protein